MKTNSFKRNLTKELKSN